MSGQLALFETATPVRREWHFLGPHPDGPESSATRQPLPGGLVALVQPEQMGDVYYYIYRAGKWVGSIYHLGGTLWSLYMPGEHGVAGWGGPALRGAAKELLRLWTANRKEVASV